MPTSILGTAADRLEAEARADQSLARKQAAAGATARLEVAGAAATSPLAARTYSDPRNVLTANPIHLEHQKLKNALLKKQIDLLDKSQEYRCCPAGSGEASSA